MHDITVIAAAEADVEEDLFQDEEYDLQVGLIASVIIIGAEIGRQACIDNHHENRLYLTRSQLLPDPRLATPWQVLYDSQSDRAFITTMGFDVQTFTYILSSGFAMHCHRPLYHLMA